ncbi:MAG: hypothetical protein PGN26_04985 [Xylophilus ampelinus]
MSHPLFMRLLQAATFAAAAYGLSATAQAPAAAAAAASSPGSSTSANGGTGGVGLGGVGVGVSASQDGPARAGALPGTGSQGNGAISGIRGRRNAELAAPAQPGDVPRNSAQRALDAEREIRPAPVPPAPAR